MGTNGQVAKVVAGVLTIAAIAGGDLPTGIDVAKLAAGTVSNAVFGYIANLRSDVQAQIDLLQPLDSDLTAIAALTGTGILARTAANTWAVRTMQQPAAGLTIANPAGIAGDPTFALANDLAALEALSGTGLACRVGSDTWAQRSIASGTGIAVSNGNGVSGNPTISIDGTVATLTDSQTLTNKTVSGSANTISNLNINTSATSGNVVYAVVTGEIATTFNTSTKYMQSPTGSTAGAGLQLRLVCLGARFASGTYKLRNLQVHLTTAPGASGTNTFRVDLWHAGSWSTTGMPTCAISGATADQDCSDSATTPSLTQGDCIGFEDAANIFSAGAGATASVEVTN